MGLWKQYINQPAKGCYKNKLRYDTLHCMTSAFRYTKNEIFPYRNEWAHVCHVSPIRTICSIHPPKCFTLQHIKHLLVKVSAFRFSKRILNLRNTFAMLDKKMSLVLQPNLFNVFAKKHKDFNKRLPLFEPFWEHDVLEMAINDGIVVSGILHVFQDDCAVYVHHTKLNEPKKYRVPDFIARNRAMHKDRVHICIDTHFTLTDGQSMTLDTFNLLKNLKKTENIVSTTKVDSISKESCSTPLSLCRVVGIICRYPRKEIICVPNKKDIDKALHGVSQTIQFSPYDTRLPYISVSIKKSNSSLTAFIINQLTNLRKKTNVVSIHDTIRNESNVFYGLSEDCIQELKRLGKLKDTVFIALKPEIMWSRYSTHPEGYIADAPNWRKSILTNPNPFYTMSNICLSHFNLEWREWDIKLDTQQYQNHSTNKQSDSWIETALNDPKRIDLRHLDIFTVDPFNAKDLDDAIHISPIDDSPGMYELGIHIADVSYFVQPGTEVDNEAFNRGASVYHMHRVVPMLPNILSNDYCSLLPHRDRLAMSLLLRIDQMGHISSIAEPQLVKSVIRSRQQLSYDDVSNYFESRIQPNGNEPSISASIKKQLDLLEFITQQIRQQKNTEGRLRLGHEADYVFLSTYSSSSLDAQWPDTLQRREIDKNIVAYSLIEEIMIIANHVIGTLLIKLFKMYNIEGIIRRHLSSDKLLKLQIIDTLYLSKHSDYIQKLDTAGEMLSALKKLETPELWLTVTQQLFNVLKRAQYIPLNISQINTKNDSMTNNSFSSMEDTTMQTNGNDSLFELHRHLLRHTALCLPSYTHFTSPIRRYADLRIHQILSAYLSSDNSLIPKISKNLLHISSHCNTVMKAQKDSLRQLQIISFNKMLQHEFPNGYSLDHPMIISITSCLDKNVQTVLVKVYIKELNVIATIEMNRLGDIIQMTPLQIKGRYSECIGVHSKDLSTLTFTVGKSFPLIALSGDNAIRLVTENKTYLSQIPI